MDNDPPPKKGIFIPIWENHMETIVTYSASLSRRIKTCKLLKFPATLTNSQDYKRSPKKGGLTNVLGIKFIFLKSQSSG